MGDDWWWWFAQHKLDVLAAVRPGLLPAEGRDGLRRNAGREGGRWGRSRGMVKERQCKHKRKQWKANERHQNGQGKGSGRVKERTAIDLQVGRVGNQLIQHLLHLQK